MNCYVCNCEIHYSYNNDCIHHPRNLTPPSVSGFYLSLDSYSELSTDQGP